MGSSLSSHEKSSTSSRGKSHDLTMSGRGRKSIMKASPHGLRSSVVSFPSEDLDKSALVDHHDEDIDVTQSETYHDDDVFVSEVSHAGKENLSDSDSEDDDDDMDEDERLLILEDARKLKTVAAFYHHPESPVCANSGSRCYFSRASAPEQELWEEAEERAAVLKDAKDLKEVAKHFMHPEKGVHTTDACVCGRNFFSRFTAVQQETEDEATEHAAIMDDIKRLKASAAYFMHPERAVTTSDPTAFGRNYFMRASAPDQESLEDIRVRSQILEDAAAFKQLALDYMHPELPVVVYATACGRNYYSRASAEEQHSIDYDEDRRQIMADMKLFKKYASDFLHPENPVVATDSQACGRNYFTRPSAPIQESVEESDERATILADSKALKNLAVEFLHPEVTAINTHGDSFGRNYFNRFSAPEQESFQEAEERALILEDAKSLKKLAIDHLHPEIKVENANATLYGRNYFSRYSAVDQLSHEDAEERTAILADLKELKKLAVDYSHPEIGVVVTDGTACGRNYFSRFSAPDQEEAEERIQILDDMKELKKLAADYLHPELPVSSTDACMFGRNYFMRPSAPIQEDASTAEERALIMHDLKALKQLAVHFLHPEAPVRTTVPSAMGRNFFSRASAPVQEEKEDADERAAVLADLKGLKKLAVDYMHPELGVVTTDTTACGRNYFDRAASALHYQNIHSFAPHSDEDSHEHEHIDHFGLDEEMEMFADIRQELMGMPTVKMPIQAIDATSEEGNLSRSPSSVFLSGLEYEY